MWTNAGRFLAQKTNDSDSSTNPDDQLSACSDRSSESDRSLTTLVSSMDITRRQSDFGISAEGDDVISAAAPTTEQVRDIASLQNLWHDLANEAGKLYSKSFWRVLQAVHNQSKLTQSKVFQAVTPMVPSQERREWPKTRSQVDSKLTKYIGSFYPRVTRRIMIDLSNCGVAGLNKPIVFSFIDPVFAWAQCAAKLSQTHKLHFKYKQLRHPESGELMYGASVANGLIMKKSCEKITRENPACSGPALFGLSWDAGNASKRRSYTPILVSVGNTDYSGLEKSICIGYLPALSITTKDLGTESGQRAKFMLTQKCTKAIIQVIEDNAQRGFKCILHNTLEHMGGVLGTI